MIKLMVCGSQAIVDKDTNSNKMLCKTATIMASDVRTLPTPLKIKAPSLHTRCFLLYLF